MEPVVCAVVRRCAALLAVALLGAGVAVSPTPAQAQAADCGKVEVVSFRGSDEGKADDGTASNGFSGPTLQKIINRARGMAEGGFTLSGAKVFGVPYPAVGAKKYLSKELDLFDSIEYGRLLGGGYIRKRHAECTSTRFLLAGYSQGVLAARRVAADLPKDWVAGVFGVGDPAQKGNAPGVAGPGASGNGIYRWAIEKDGKASTDAFYDLGLPSYLYCHVADPVCDAFKFVPKWPPLDFEAHNYGTTTAEQATLARQLLVMAAEAAGRPAPPPPTAGAADLMFVIDTTGSMSPYLAAAVDSAARTADALQAATPQARVGLVEYRDHGDSYVARTVVPLTDDFDAFDTGLRGLGANGGGDTPEAVYTGIVTALGADWNRSASRSLIVLGDAPAHDPEPVTDLTAAIVTDIAKGVAPMPELPPTVGGADRASVPTQAEPTPQTEPAAPGQKQEPSAPDARIADAAPMGAPGETVPPVAVYALSANTELTTQLTPISEATGGKALPLESPDDVTQSIIDTVEDAATAPTARLTTADTVIVGNETVLSGLGSTHTGDEATFGFDFDNDGTIDETNTEGAATHKYATAGPVEARLVVTDSRGRTSETTVSIEVRTLDSLQTSVPVTSTPPTTEPSTEPNNTETPTNADDSNLASTGVPGLLLLVTAGLLLLACGVGVLIAARRRHSRTHSEA